MRFSFVVIMATSLVIAALTGACAPPAGSKEPVGVSDKAELAADQSVDMDGGGDNYACANSPSLLEGKPCAPEGANCGSPSADPHQFTNTLTCHAGQWERVEVGPLPPSKP